MTAKPPHSPVTEVVRSLVRSIFPGQLETAVARWFSRFPATTESRQDTYRARGIGPKCVAMGDNQPPSTTAKQSLVRLI
jgi:hypothetical protein